jgi:hypothetical protein
MISKIRAIRVLKSWTLPDRNEMPLQFSRLSRAHLFTVAIDGSDLRQITTGTTLETHRHEI